MDILLVAPLATDCCRDDDPLAARPCCANTFQAQLQSSYERATKMFGRRCLRQILQILFCRQTPYNRHAPQRANACSSQYDLDYLVTAIPSERSETTKAPAVDGQALTITHDINVISALFDDSSFTSSIIEPTWSHRMLQPP
jgi:hypothetical protein